LIRAFSKHHAKFVSLKVITDDYLVGQRSLHTHNCWWEWCIAFNNVWSQIAGQKV